MPQKVQAVAAIIERGGRFPFGKRSPHRLSAPGYWCTVSGRSEPGESDAPAQLLGDEHTELRWVTLEEMWALSPVFAEDLEIIARASECLER